MSHYSDSLDPETMGMLLKPMLHGEGWKVVLGIIGRLMAKHEQASNNATVEINTRLDRIGRAEGLKELLSRIYRIAGEDSPIIPHLEFVFPAPAPPVVQHTEEEKEREPKPLPRRRSGSVA